MIVFIDSSYTVINKSYVTFVNIAGFPVEFPNTDLYTLERTD